MKISTVIAATLHTLRHDRTPLEEASDSDLRHRFNSNGDAEAFAAVVRRHGPVVRNTCQCWLAGPADVDDVSQATFLVLARRPKTGRRPEALAAWLHGVAVRLARQLHADRARRHRHERRAEQKAGTHDPLSEITARELVVALDAEILGLPERERLPLVLCYLAGKTQAEAASEWGWSKGTLRRRLKAGQESMRRRLERRGWDRAAMLLLFALRPAGVAVPLELARETVQAAGVMRLGGELGRAGALATGFARGLLAAQLWASLRWVVLRKREPFRLKIGNRRESSPRMYRWGNDAGGHWPGPGTESERSG